jgi:hypothetical protein
VTALAEITPEVARHVLWSMGNLQWKLKPHQHLLYNAYRKARQRTTVFHCSRRIGKSFTLCLIADEVARSKERAQVRYAAPTQKNVRDIILPVMQEILSDCPKRYRPQWKGQDGHYVYPNGSTVSIAGTDGGNADRLRGSACDLGILDEAGFMDNLSYVVRSILMPQFITTDGRLIISSSSPISPAHDFVNYLERAEAAGSLARMTIYEDSRPEVLARIPEWQVESGGKDSTDWLREYECKIIVDETRAIVPEFTEAARFERLVKEVPRPAHYDSYVSMDVGFNDLTAVLFGYWDFANAALVIEDEVSLNRMTTEHLASSIKAKEKALWPKPPMVRVSDTDLIVIHDLNELHNLGFIPTAKDDKEAAVNLLRLLVAKEKLWIHPRCKGLISHLKYGVWNKQRSQFDRAEGFGHFDFVDSLVYLVRNLRREKNPYPHHLGLSDFTHYIPEELRSPAEVKGLRSAFGLK